MLLKILQQFNWVDILTVLVVVRICYIAGKNGVPVEIFKLIGTIVGLYIALHYYTVLSDWLSRIIPEINERLPLDFLDFLTFLALLVFGYLAFSLLRNAFYHIVKMEVATGINKWGGLVLGIMRAFLFAGLVIFMLQISGVNYLKTSVKSSYLGKKLFTAPPDTYSWIWNNISSKFMTKEKFNKTILEVQDDFNHAE